MSRRILPPEQPPADESYLKQSAKAAVGGLGCLAVLAVVVTLAFVVVVTVLDEPAYQFVVVALGSVAILTAIGRRRTSP